jgi:hypothetical protein
MPIHAEYKKDKHPFPNRSTGDSLEIKGHHPEILPPFSPHPRKTSPATATFRPIPAGRPADALPCRAGDSILG